VAPLDAEMARCGFRMTPCAPGLGLGQALGHGLGSW
jgi:hypothetical protein